MRMGDDDVGDRLRRDADLGEHAHRRYPVRDAELSREAGTVLVLHEARIDEDIAVAAPRQHEGERQIDAAVLVHAADQVDPGLLVRARIFDDVEIPGICHQMFP